MLGHWHLPGPRRFLEKAFDGLRDGCCIVLQLPPHAPEGASEELGRHVADAENRSWHPTSAVEFDAANVFELVCQIATRFLPLNKQPSDYEIRTFVAAFGDRILWVDVADARHWEIWRDLLERVRLENHAIPEADRPLLCISLAPQLDAPGTDVGLKVLRFRNVVGRIDTQLAIEQRRGAIASSNGSIAEEIAVGVATCLAGTDLHLADFLAQQSLRDLLQPTQLLRQYAKLTPWLNTVDVPDWRYGTQDVFCGAAYVHSGHPSANGESRELERRIWKGQVAVLFPYIEDRRQNLIPIITPLLGSLKSLDSNVEDPFDLELGPLVRLLRNRNVPPQVWRELCRLRDIRHSLAHLEVVPYDVIATLDL